MVTSLDVCLAYNFSVSDPTGYEENTRLMIPGRGFAVCSFVYFFQTFLVLTYQSLMFTKRSAGVKIVAVSIPCIDRLTA
jgi:hypothetical protein